MVASLYSGCKMPMNIKRQLRYSGSLCDELTCLLLPLVTAHGIVPPSQEERARNQIVHATWLTASLHFFTAKVKKLSLLPLLRAHCSVSPYGAVLEQIPFAPLDHSEWQLAPTNARFPDRAYRRHLNRMNTMAQTITAITYVHHVDHSVFTLKPVQSQFRLNWFVKLPNLFNQSSFAFTLCKTRIG